MGDGGVPNSDASGISDAHVPLPDGTWPTNDAVVHVGDGGVIIETDGGIQVCYVTACAGHVLECGDCVDNDGDGKVDPYDPECLGPCDNTEGPGLNGGVGGETGGPCKADCYFDFGNGAGNDDCYWDHRCDPLEVAPSYPPEGEDCAYEQSRLGSRDCPDAQSDTCLDFCLPLTPNGCDCFGCCTFPDLATSGPNGGPAYVWIGNLDAQGNGLCTYQDIQDAAKCPPCTPVMDCVNECGHCEICVGKPTLPPDCYPPPDGGVPDGGITDGGVPPPPDGGTLQCPGGEQPCGLAGQDPCPVSYYCITGCCQYVPQ